MHQQYWIHNATVTNAKDHTNSVEVTQIQCTLVFQKGSKSRNINLSQSVKTLNNSYRSMVVIINATPFLVRYEKVVYAKSFLINILACIHNTNVLSIVLRGYIFVIPRLCWVHGNILACQEAITLGFALGISLPDT